MIGVGLDAVDVGRFREVLARRPTFVERVFSPGERAEMALRADPVPGFAARFAAKEATMKALGVGLGAFDFSEVEVERTESGQPRLHTSGRAAALAASLGATKFSVTLTHTDGLAAAVVLVT